MNDFSKQKDIVDAMAEAASLDNKVAKAFNDLRKGINTAANICEVMNLRDGYCRILNWLFIDELSKGYHTPQDSQLCKNCLDGLAACNNELYKICYRYSVDKVQSELMHYVFGNNE